LQAAGEGSIAAPMSAFRLLSWLVTLALLVTPLAMTGGAPAMAHGGAAAGACPDMEKPPEAPAKGTSADCMMACMAIVAQSPGLAARQRLSPAPEPSFQPGRLTGVAPEAAIPPPRFS